MVKQALAAQCPDIRTLFVRYQNESDDKLMLRSADEGAMLG